MKILSKIERSHIVKKLALEHGFSACGIAQAGYLEDEAPRFTRWLQKGYHGTMTYMENHFDKRLDPTKLVPGSKSVVMLLYNYYPKETLPEENNFKIARYAYGEDYHFVIKEKLKSFIEAIREKAGKVEGRAFVDSAPVLERVWAQKAGLGWIGKNSLLLGKKKGSFFFLAELILDLEMEYDPPTTDHCGSCTACLDACPTGALVAPYTLDAGKCISFLTIESRDSIPEEFRGKFQNWIFGCDICQEVCPWNRFSTPHQEARFTPSEELSKYHENKWLEITREVFTELFGKSPLQRAKFEGIKRNINYLKK